MLNSVRIGQRSEILTKTLRLTHNPTPEGFILFFWGIRKKSLLFSKSLISIRNVLHEKRPCRLLHTAKQHAKT